jgi:hypothetical protein
MLRRASVLQKLYERQRRRHTEPLQEVMRIKETKRRAEDGR